MAKLAGDEAPKQSANPLLQALLVALGIPNADAIVDDPTKIEEIAVEFTANNGRVHHSRIRQREVTPNGETLLHISAFNIGGYPITHLVQTPMGWSARIDPKHCPVGFGIRGYGGTVQFTHAPIIRFARR